LGEQLLIDHKGGKNETPFEGGDKPVPEESLCCGKQTHYHRKKGKPEKARMDV